MVVAFRWFVPLLASVAVVTPCWSQETPRPLREFARRQRLLVGTAVGYSELVDDPRFAQTAARECNLVTTENELKWGIVHPAPDTFDFTRADAIVDFARANRMKVRGHTLVWHQQNPAWLTNGTFTRDELIALLRTHIHTVAGRYRRRIKHWDVVNEAFDDASGTLRDTLWLRGIGPEYIELAFQFAHEAAPRAKLFYNDFLIELIGPKFDAVYALVADLKARGVPIHGVGFQAHAFLSTSCTTCFDQMATRFKQIADLGLEVAITELDVPIVQPTTPAALADQAVLYDTALAACLSVRRCRTFVMWGLTDRYSWIPSFFPTMDDALILDRDYAPKPAYFALRDRLAGPRR